MLTRKIKQSQLDCEASPDNSRRSTRRRNYKQAEHRSTTMDERLGLDLRGIARETYRNLLDLLPMEQCYWGTHVLLQTGRLGQGPVREHALRGLAVMDQFPHYPRARAAVLMKTLFYLAHA